MIDHSVVVAIDTEDQAEDTIGNALASQLVYHCHSEADAMMEYEKQKENLKDEDFRGRKLKILYVSAYILYT